MAIQLPKPTPTPRPKRTSEPPPVAQKQTAKWLQYLIIVTITAIVSSAVTYTKTHTLDQTKTPEPVSVVNEEPAYLTKQSYLTRITTVRHVDKSLNDSPLHEAFKPVVSIAHDGDKYYNGETYFLAPLVEMQIVENEDPPYNIDTITLLHPFITDENRKEIRHSYHLALNGLHVPIINQIDQTVDAFVSATGTYAKVKEDVTLRYDGVSLTRQYKEDHVVFILTIHKPY